MSETKKELNLKETARFLRVSRPTIYKMVALGELKPVSRGTRIWAFDIASLERWKIMSEIKKQMNLKETAAFLGVSAPTILRMVAQGHLEPASRGIRNWAFDIAKLQQIKERKHELA